MARLLTVYRQRCVTPSPAVFVRARLTSRSCLASLLVALAVACGGNNNIVVGPTPTPVAVLVGAGDIGPCGGGW